MSEHPKRRSTDHRYFDPRSNLYRDLWLLIITLTMLGAMLAFKTENRQRITDIQRSRAESIRTSCLAQNRRHDEALRTLNQIVQDRLPKVTPFERRRLIASQATTATLIESLVPHQNCDRIVARFVKPVQ